MTLESARQLKKQILSRIDSRPEAIRSTALGVAPRAEGDYVLAVRLRQPDPDAGEWVESIRRQAAGEVDIRFVGSIARMSGPPHPTFHQRPLWIGCSIGHTETRAGTLGCFVRNKSGSGPVMILSNNHVLADENRAAAGDAVLQPGPFDDGRDPRDAVARLTRFVPLRVGQINRVDCAVAALAGGVDFVPDRVDRLALRGVAPQFPAGGGIVRKRGRSALTRGRVSAFELDNVVVAFESGNLRFDDQIEIEGRGPAPFSKGGDSGSLIIDESGRAVALLFATGGAGAYANPIQRVFDALKVELFLGG